MCVCVCVCVCIPPSCTHHQSALTHNKGACLPSPQRLFTLACLSEHGSEEEEEDDVKMQGGRPVYFICKAEMWGNILFAHQCVVQVCEMESGGESAKMDGCILSVLFQSFILRAVFC